MAKVAVVLSGCGVYDGSEIHEAVAVLYHLSRAGAAYECFAPDKPQMHVVDHATGQAAPGQTRNVLEESARIARGKIRPLAQLHARDFDCVIFPGGFGAAKNLCDFAVKGAEMAVDPDAERVVKEFHGSGKPVGMCCIAPVIGAKVLGTRAGGPGAQVTIGDDAQAAAAIAAWGSKNIVKRVTESQADEANRLVTAAAYMYGGAPVHEVFEGIGRMVEGVLSRVGKR
ncbi:MAG: isoprenoid biosynthesis glyoxalase ElbB [Phycisphaeraceae bacterium]|nr:isoprenoid biosynthesis glyoxalase ElbB [Phycisphaeraceae bacterium]